MKKLFHRGVVTGRGDRPIDPRWPAPASTARNDLAQYTSIAFTDALRDAGLIGSIGTVGDALDNALMESAIGLYKTELIDRQRSWTGRGDVERATATLVHWYNTTRLHSALGHMPPDEFEPAPS